MQSQNAMKASLLAQADQSQLIIIDMQEKLAAAMPEDSMQAVIRNCSILIQAARLLEVPTVYTEQYPKGLGPTLASLQTLLENIPRIEKMAFSCHAVPAFRSQLTTDRPQLVLTGMETHICVLQTAMDLHKSGHQVLIVEDAVLSRTAANKANAMERLRQAGIVVSNTESIVFEWLGRAEGEAFKQISRLVR
ncbi:hydrolase [Methylobacillus caricis]|uniref:hydrolase n=1 Tax=Methylobacillus caricis TaxID=1971611 RepID=UPI001CFF7B47|nr:hydrolase [Methylobacillus caricis]MCB5188857.1 hydrolase [Methylobacillus caricis]